MLKVLSDLLKIVFVDLNREELNTFALGVFSKLFKRTNLVSLLPSIFKIIAEHSSCNDSKSAPVILD